MKIHLLRFRRCAPGLSGKPNSSAFTFTELLVVLVVLCLLAALALPALAGTRFRSQQSVCANNLSRIGQAFAQWGNDHGDRYPITLPWWEGGTSRPSYPGGFNPPAGAIQPQWWLLGLQNNAWFQFWWVSNELATPKVLACPSDPLKRAASDFSRTNADGFLTNSNRNNSVSYAITHSFAEDGRLVQIAERSFDYAVTGGGGGCVYGFQYNGQGSILGPTPWRGIHPGSGSLLFTDGSVEHTDDKGLEEAMGRFLPVLGSYGLGKSYPHFLVPN